MISPPEMVRLLRLGRETIARGENVVARLDREGAPHQVSVEIAYALQSGSYTDYAGTDMARATRTEGHAILEAALSETGSRTLLDCGAGEGTRWLDFGGRLDRLVLLEASWARLTYAERHLATLRGLAAWDLVKADMASPPFAPGSFDAVFTSHALEPNDDGTTAAIIPKLFGLARRLVVLMEPNYRNAHSTMRARMETHGYARNIWDVAEAQPGWTRIAAGRLAATPNPDNLTSYLVLRRDVPLPDGPIRYVDPITGLVLTPREDRLVDEIGCFAYPRIGGIACLTGEDGIFIGQPSEGAERDAGGTD